jgi:type VI secretion system protein ImpC
MAKETVQKKLERARPPRVHITYDLETGGAIQERELPFEVLILADLSGHAESPKPLRERKLVDIDLDKFDDVLSRYAPRLAFEVPNKLGGDDPALRFELRFRCLEDFEPARVASQIEPLKNLFHERSEFMDRIRKAEGDDRSDGREIASMQSRVDAIDSLLSSQLTEIMHSRPFQSLEATWRGLHFLVSQTETSAALRLKVLDVTKRELSRDFQRSVEFAQSALFKHVYEAEYGTFGGNAIGVMIGDYEIGPGPSDMDLIEQLSHVAATAHAPFLAGAAPTLFDIESFAELGSPRDLSKVFETIEHARWRSFRESEDARYVGLVLPRILLRRPYGDTNPTEEFNFQERIERHDDWLWGNAVYALGACITNAFAKFGWCAAIKGVESGGLVEGLPTGTFVTEYRDTATKCPVEIALSDRREIELAHLGLIPLLHFKGTDCAAFFSMQTCCKPLSYESAAANANARLSTQLQYVLTTSRFAHYLKHMIRDRLGSFASRADCQNWLNAWLRKYVAQEDGLSLADKARYPLREAYVDVTEVPGKPGVYRAVAFLRPHFQLDELSVSMRVVVELPAPATH